MPPSDKFSLLLSNFIRTSTDTQPRAEQARGWVGLAPHKHAREKVSSINSLLTLFLLKPPLTAVEDKVRLNKTRL